VYKKYKKGGVRKVAKYAGKKIYRRYSTGGVRQVVKDVAMLKNMLNTEKKYYDATFSDTLGQVNGNLSGATYKDLTPLPVQNVAYNGRTGQGLKLVSAQINIIVNNQSAQRTKQRIRFEMYYVKGDTKTLAGISQELYDINPLTSIVDYMSNRQPNNMKDFKKICTRYIYYPSEDHSGTGSASRQKTLKINLKLSHHLRFDKNSLTLQSGQIFIFAVTETGNSSPAIPSTLPNIANVAVNSGFDFDISTRFYYVDN
jgi:hypothetical protein